MCSQYPTGDILPRQVKQNSDARLSFRLPTSTASGVILDETGAEDLPYKVEGRGIYKTDGKALIQVPYLSNEEIDKLIQPFIQEELAYGDTNGEEEKEGLRDTADTGSLRNGEPVPTSRDSSTWIEPQCDENYEELGEVYQPFPAE
jgi:S-DNA-T family DNA segregation ATPase FtsK/SpoIIIE